MRMLEKCSKAGAAKDGTAADGSNWPILIH